MGGCLMRYANSPAASSAIAAPGVAELAMRRPAKENRSQRKNPLFIPDGLGYIAAHQAKICGRGGIGRRAALRSLWGNSRGSSSLLDRTIKTPENKTLFCSQGFLVFRSVPWRAKGVVEGICAGNRDRRVNAFGGNPEAMLRTKRRVRAAGFGRASGDALFTLRNLFPSSRQVWGWPDWADSSLIAGPPMPAMQPPLLSSAPDGDDHPVPLWRGAAQSRRLPGCRMMRPSG